MEAVEVLLACKHYDEQSVDRRLCRNFSVLRYQAASLIVKAAQRTEYRSG